MERVIKFLSVLILLCFGMCSFAFADEPSMQQLTTPQTVPYSNCNKTYNLPGDKLYYLTLASISANRFEIKELQSKTGYILFKAAGKEFLASVVYYSANKSLLKITPANNNYYFAPGIVSNIFKYIDININAELEIIQKS